MKEIEKERKNKDKSNWRAKHEELVEAMQYNRKVKAVEDRGGDVRSIQAPKSKVTESYI